MKRLIYVIPTVLLLFFVIGCGNKNKGNNEPDKPAVPTVYYNVTFNANGGEIVDGSAKISAASGSLITPPTVERAGYSLTSWFCDGKEWIFTKNTVDEEVTLEAHWKPNTYNISYEFDQDVENLNNPTTYKTGETKNLVKLEKKGYIFVGWHYAEDLSDDVVTKVENQIGDIKLYGEFLPRVYFITYNLNDGSDSDPIQQDVIYDNPFELLVPEENPGYYFIGWFKKNYDRFESGVYNIADDLDLIAIWLKGGYSENDQLYVDFGTYPQTLVTDTTLITSLNGLIEINKKGYYEYNGEEYAKVFANPYSGSYTFSNGQAIEQGKAYWFKVEPIKWRVLDTNYHDSKLLSEYILDNGSFQTSVVETSSAYYNTNPGAPSDTFANNYEYSDIRTWLEAFHVYSFNDEEKSMALSNTISNNSSSTGFDNNPYATENTTWDHAFLLSRADMGETKYGFASDLSNVNSNRSAKVTDYAIACGAFVNDGYGIWWLRSPHYSASNYTCYVTVNGQIEYANVTYAFLGIRPSIVLDY